MTTDKRSSEGIHTCKHCGKNPAACMGQYDNEPDVAPACDVCCGHGNEDGFCEPITDFFAKVGVAYGVASRPNEVPPVKQRSPAYYGPESAEPCDFRRGDQVRLPDRGFGTEGVVNSISVRVHVEHRNGSIAHYTPSEVTHTAPRSDNPKDDDLDMRMKLVAWVNDNADRGLTSVDVAGVRRIVDVSRPAKALFNCGARKANTGAGDPAECDWPHCGCDPHADKVIEALNEQGMLRDPREQRVVHASCTPTTDFGCEARAKLAKARGALTSVLQELIDMGGSSSEELIEEVTRALEESAQPQPCET